MKKVCVVTGTRAEYGLLRWVMQGIAESRELGLQTIATGAHLSPEFGLTYRDIEADGFHLDHKVEMLLSADTPTAIAKSMGLATIGFATAFADLRPDLVLLLGDRYEIFSAATSAMIAGIAIAHLHGGETTEGAIDEAMRHSITKMSQLHFVAAEDYRRRVIQMGEDPSRVFLVGGLGVDSIRKQKLLDRVALEAELGFMFGPKNLLITFHPVTMERGHAERQFNELLAALDALEDTHLFFTMPNADTEGRALRRIVEAYVAANRHARAFTSLGSVRFLSTIKQVDAVVGNSSSGLLEAPTLGVATIDIGNRQAGRLRADSVISCAPERDSIKNALSRVYSAEFKSRLRQLRSPYGEGGASAKVVEILEAQDFDSILKKRFHDLPTGRRT